MCDIPNLDSGRTTFQKGAPNCGSMRLLAFAPGQIWSGWALLSGDRLITSGIALSEAYLSGEADQTLIAKLDRLNRRLIGLRRAVSDVVTHQAPIDYFVCWNPPTSASVVYAARAGQYIGMMKGVCFEQRLPVLDVSEDEARALFGIPTDAAREALETAVMTRLGHLELPTCSVTYDDGSIHTARPTDAIAVGLTAYARVIQSFG